MERAWMLHTPNSSLVVAVSEMGAVVQRYWGPRLDNGSLATFEQGHRDRWNSSFERPAEMDEQLPVGGGARWALPALQARFPDGVRTLSLTFDMARTQENVLILSLRDADAQLRVELSYTVHPDDDAIDRTVTVFNDHPDREVLLTKFDSGSWLIPDLVSYRTSVAHGYWGGEFQVERQNLARGEYRIGSRHGVTGHLASPWMMIDEGTATETSGNVWSLALEWSGSWHLTAQHRAEGAVTITGGWTQDGVQMRIDPGTSLTTPVLSGMFRPDGFGGTSRAWQDIVRRRILPSPTALRPVLYNSWEATEFDIDLATELVLAEHAADLGVELFVVDDGWFHGRHHDHAGLGDWWPDETKFPDGLRPLSDKVHSLGMLFGVWVEPEMVNEHSDLFKAHPEWVQQWPDRAATEIRNQRVLDFGLSAVQEFTLDWFDRLVDENRVDFVKWDMNRPFTDVGRINDLEHSDDIWRTHTEGVYRVFDLIRERHPDLILEGCSSGGARVDLGMMRRVDQVWTSDNTDALDRQTIQHGHSQLYPANTMGAWVTDHTNIVSQRTIPLEYRFHVAMAGALGIGADIRTWSVQDKNTARRLIKLYKHIRPTVQNGTLFRLGGRPGVDQSAVQYVDADRTVVIAYDPHRSLSDAPRRLRLEGLHRDALYRDANSGQTASGAWLMGYGIKANRDENDRGWNNLRFSNRDYVSTVSVWERV